MKAQTQDQPCSLAAEQAVLGAILLRPQVLSEVIPLISPQSFYRVSHGLIYQAMIDLHETGKPVDLVTVTWLLKERSQLEKIGGLLFLSGLSESVGIAANAGYYAKRVQDKARVRELLSRLPEIQKACLSANGNVNEVLLFAESLINEAVNNIDFAEVLAISGQTLLKKIHDQGEEVIANGILPKGGGLILAGESGEGKSLLRLELAIHLALGQDLWNLDVPTAQKVLIIQFENTEFIEAYRLKKMLEGLGIDTCPDNLLFSTPSTRFDLGDKKDLALLIQMIGKYQAQVVIYDPLSSLHRANENDNAQMRWIMDNLTQISRRTNTSSIVVHHYGKPSKDDSGNGYRTRGASSIKDWCDTLIGVSRQKGETILRTLDFVKVRNGPEPKSVTLERNKETFVHFLVDQEEICPPGKVKAILARLGGRVESQEELLKAIMEETDCGVRRARHFVKQAVSTGAIISEPHPTDSRKVIYHE